MAVGRVTDDPHINPVAVPNVLLDDRWGARKEVLRGGPTTRIRDIWVRRIGSVAVLEHEIPQLVRSKIEHLRSCSVAGSDRSLIKVCEGGRVGLVEITEAEIRKV